MKRFAPGLAALAMVGMTACAHAETADGQIIGIDPEAMTVTLDTGGPYKVMREGMLNELKTGNQAIIIYEVKDGEKIASEILQPEEGALN